MRSFPSAVLGTDGHAPAIGLQFDLVTEIGKPRSVPATLFNYPALRLPQTGLPALEYGRAELLRPAAGQSIPRPFVPSTNISFLNHNYFHKTSVIDSTVCREFKNGLHTLSPRLKPTKTRSLRSSSGPRSSNESPVWCRADSLEHVLQRLVYWPLSSLACA